jgi:hypothetical protein
MTRVVTPEQAAEALEYFNGFHDGFIKRLTLFSHDYFESRGAQVCSGRLDLEMTIAHYNYRDGEPPPEQVVHARFVHIRHLRADLPGNEAEWSLANVHFMPGTRVTLRGEEPCVYARFLQNRLEDGERWVLYEAIAFSFREATFREAPPA